MENIQNKTYCIITPSISDMGGAQLYTLRRINYLKKFNTKVIVITGRISNFMLKDRFGDTEILSIPEIIYPPVFYSSSVNTKVKGLITDFLNRHKPEIIETHSLATAIYGEVGASMIGAKHIIYLLNEDKVKRSDGTNITEYFFFKLRRGELFGVSNMSLNIILNCKLDKYQNKYINIAFDKEELDNQFPLELLDEIRQNAFIITTIARLEKTYIKVLIKAVIKLAQKFKEKQFSLIIIGSSSNKNILTELRKKYKSSVNLEFHFPGYLYPIPSILFQKSDIFIGQGTASVNSISQSCATAVVDPRDNNTSGFLGVHTSNFGYPDKGIKFSIYDILEKSVLNPELLLDAGLKGLQLFEKEFELNIVMKRFDEEIFNSKRDVEFWKFKFRKSTRRIIESLIIRIAGLSGYQAFFMILLKFRIFSGLYNRVK